MTRTRATAKKAGSSFERLVADYLATHVDDRIDRRVKNGTKDRGDIAGLRHMGHRVVIECKNTSKIALGGWATEAETERGNDDALAGIIVHKRVGKGRPEDQWVTLTLGELVALLTGTRDHYETTKNNQEGQAA
ncbi:holliday junction resolvase [Arthrobacter phage Peas]|uniref:Holliday junction resolvase n=1 Tax=Arthrobacter phage Peas TaxID=2419965 RepID=A0A3G2KIF8_9CAUD|nr:RusA-like Holliday junction resolvase [Arthrobacter phage Peas]AYN58751.1 holliday junction resolvase [Arthrobacter phage Peas]